MIILIIYLKIQLNKYTYEILDTNDVLKSIDNEKIIDNDQYNIVDYENEKETTDYDCNYENDYQSKLL